MATLSQLILYPIKSCAGMAVDTARVSVSGLQASGVHDREWMLVTPEGQFLTQREFPRMATIVPRVEEGALLVSAPGVAVLRLPLARPDAPSTLRVQIWDDFVEAADCGDAAARWFGRCWARLAGWCVFRAEGRARPAPNGRPAPHRRHALPTLTPCCS
ncbi:MOSC domain-containing protein [Massilia sp. Dwa41.01b]|uniref:MOSC domain-containing protein n=1 Tax=Massilia sp. Dwa41.01b TaxID=2709302 RepID=UPI002804A5EE|nr:MOSC domain-containing protein [Massilia sp. Dwa41.01b]